MTEKILRFRWLIIAVMVLAFVPKTVQAQTMEPTKNAEGYYQIASKDDLYWFANKVNSGETTICAILTQDIIVNENVLNETGSLINPNLDEDLILWKPIGNNKNQYTGTFDGRGYAVRGLFFSDKNQNYVGFFGCIGKNENNIGIIKNVGVVDSYFYGSTYVGGVCGANNDGAIIVSCYNASSVGGNTYVGGVCGDNCENAKISNCYNIGYIISRRKVGGVCGDNYKGTIEYCYNSGTINVDAEQVGGVCGISYEGNIENCFNIGNISGSEYVGGVCGSIYNGITQNCYNVGSVSSNYNVGGLCGSNNNGKINNCYYYSGSCIKKETCTEGERKEENAFICGEVTWLLNGNITDGIIQEKNSPWLQNLITEEGDRYPVLKANTSGGVCPIVLKDGNGYKNDDTHNYSDIATTPDAVTINLYSYHCTKCNADNKKVIKNLTKNNDTDIEIKKDGTEPWKTTSAIDLTDAAYYNAPVEFTTTGGVTFNFTRTADVKWATLCLPYKITTSKYTDKCRFYKLNSVGENEIVLGELSGEIAAGTPVFVKSENDFNVDFSIPANTEIEMTTAPQDQSATDGTLIGTFEEKTLTEDDNANDLFIKENLMWSVSQAQRTMKVKPFRAYIVPATSSGAPQRSITIDGEATAISDAFDTLNDANAEYYDMSGRRINSLQKGVNIIRSGNKTKKVIIK